MLRKQGKWVGLMLAAVLVAAMAGWSLSQAQQEADIGYVDVPTLQDKYLIPAIEGPLDKERDRLQAEFDSKSKSLNDQQKQQLFAQYQQQLDEKKQQLVNAQLPKIQAAVEKVAKAQGLKLVLDKQAILYGGQDITQAVLLQLGVKVSK